MRELVTVDQVGPIAIVRCYGELDLATRDRLAAGLTQLHLLDISGVVLDLSGVEFMDCSALNVVITLARDCSRARVGMVLAGARPVVRSLLLALDLDQALTLIADAGDAVRLALAWARDDDFPPAAVALAPSAATSGVSLIPRPGPARDW